MATKTLNTYCVVYRKGTEAAFSWHRTFAMVAVEAAAFKLVAEKEGHRAMVVNYAQSMAIGLPEGWEA